MEEVDCRKFQRAHLTDTESALQLVDHSDLTRDGIHFNIQQGAQWVNDGSQIEELEVELQKMVNPMA